MLDRNKRKALMWSSVALFAINGAMNGYYSMTTGPDHNAEGMASDIPSISLIQEKPLSHTAPAQSQRVGAMHDAASDTGTDHHSDASTAESKSEAPTHAKEAPATQVHVPADAPEVSTPSHQTELSHETSHETEAMQHVEPVHEAAPVHEAESVSGREHSASMTMVCYESGPFVSSSAARKMQKAVSSLGINASIKKKVTREKLGYWVYLKPERSLALSRLKAEEVKVKGIEDVAVVIKSEPKYAISLGVFNNKQTAEARKIKAESLGFQPLLTTRYNSETQRWVQMKMPVDKEPSEEQWRGLLKGKKGIEIKPMECKP